MELKDWVRAALKHGKVTLQAMGDEVGVSKAAVGHWQTGESRPSFEQIMKIVKKTGFPPPVEELTRAPALPESGVDQDLSHPVAKVPSLTSWEVLMSKQQMPAIPADLMVEMPDGALEPKIMKGEHLWFRPANSAKPRNVILIEAEGRRWIRRYAEGEAGPEAQALDDAYRSFRQFTIIAKLYMRPQDSI